MIRAAAPARAARWVVAIAVAILAASCGGDPAVQPTRSPTRDPTPSPTAAPSSQRVVVAVKGDWGAGTQAQRAVTRRMCAMREAEGFLDVLTTGDNFYPSGRARPETYQEPERCLYEWPGHRWRATWGNHDQANATAELLGADRWYRWSAGEADFFALDSNRPTDPQQRAWLQGALAQSRARVKVAYFHHPPFTAGSVHEGAAAVRNLWVPMFERYGVQLVLAGHNHVYERYRIDGIDYVTTGGGGQVLYRCRDEPAMAPIVCLERHHFLIVAIEGERIEVRAIDRGGRVIDRFERG